MKCLYFLSLVVSSILFAETLPLSQQNSIKIDHFKIIGNKKIDTQILLNTIQKYQGKELYVADITHIAEEITQKYRVLGFERARAYIPIQTVHDGMLKIIVTMDKKAQDEPEILAIDKDKLVQVENHPIVIKQDVKSEIYPVIEKEEKIQTLSQVFEKPQVKIESTQEDFIKNLINESIQKSPAVLSKDSAFQAALSAEDGAKWQYFPTPTVSTEQGESGKNVTIVRIQQPLWAGGRIDAEYNKAKKLADVAKMSIEELKQNLALLTSEALYSILSSYGHKLVYEDAVQRLEGHKAMIARRVERGISPESELLLVNTRLVQAKTDVSMAYASLEKSLSLLSQRLTRTITIDELKPILPLFTCKVYLPSQYDNDQFVNNVLSSHPGMERYQRQVESAGYEVEIKKANLLPTVYAKAEKQWDNKVIDTKTSFVLGVQYTPGAGFSSLSAVETARANFLSMQQEKENFQLELKQKVMAEWSDYSFTTKRYENYVMAVDTTQQTAESYNRLFISGKRSWLDMLNAEKEWSSAQISLSDVQAYLITTPIRLKIYANELDWQKGYK